MKIGIVSKVLTISGNRLISRNTLAHMFTKLGHEVFIIGLREKNLEKLKWDKKLKLIVVPYRKSNNYYLQRLYYFLHFRQALKKLITEN